MFKSFVQILLIMALSMPLVPLANAAPNINAESYILMDMETGEVIVAKNEDLRLPPASLAKVFSTYVYFKSIKDGVISLDEETVISRNAWASRVEGSKMFIEVDTRVTISDLLHGVIIQSGNDASIALAEAIAGDEATFAELVNAEMQKLGLENTNIVNSTGLPGKNQYITAKDAALLARQLIHEFPELYEIYSKTEFTYNDIKQNNRNRLLGNYPGADGVKTGYTKKAGYGFIGSAEQEGRRLISVVMKTKSARVRFEETRKLLNYGFKQTKNVTLYQQDDVRELPIWEGVKQTIKVTPSEAGVFTVARTNNQIKTLFEPVQQSIKAPIRQGDVLGKIVVKREDVVLKETPVVAAESVEQASRWERLLDTLKSGYLGHESGERKMLSEW